MSTDNKKEPAKKELTTDEYIRILDGEMENICKRIVNGNAVRARWEKYKKGLKDDLIDMLKVLLEASANLAHCGGTTDKPANATRRTAKAATVTKAKADKAAAKAKLPKPDVPAAGKGEKKKKKERAAGSVQVSDHSLSCYLGSFAVAAVARRDASEFLSNDKVFWYRRALFPDPTAAKVQPKVMSAKVVERKGAQFTRSPYTVAVVIDIQGDAAHCRAWAEGVVGKNRGDQE